MLAFAVTPSLLHADAFDQATKFTFSQPVQIPGRILPAGTYWFKLLDSSNRQVVEVLAEDRTPIAMLYSFSRERSSSGPRTLASSSVASSATASSMVVGAWYSNDEGFTRLPS